VSAQTEPGRRLYNFPREYDGSGQCIGILELGDFRPDDIES